MQLLSELVVAAGAPSHREIAKRVGPLMRPPRVLSKSTISEVFQPGRRRLNFDLVMAIVRVLGLPDREVAGWLDACVRLHAEARTGGPASVFRQLPADLATFTGRTAAVKALIDASSAPGDVGPRTVVVSAIEGMGGVGKTRLALHVAHELVRAGRFADVQLYVNLRGFDPEHAPADPSAVLEAFLRQLEVPARRIPDGLDERAAMFRDRMHGRSALILLDNAADAEQVRPLIPADPGCLVLVTSRRSLTELADAVLHRLDVFDARESLELLERIAGVERVRAEPDSAAAVVEFCGHLPLAVSLVASQLRSRPAWSLRYLMERLEAGRLDAVRGGRQNLQTVFECSYRNLPPDAQRMFRLLSLHPGDSYTALSAAALADIEAVEADSLLELLTDEYLLQQPGSGRYEFHDLIRLFAVEHGAGEVQRDGALDRLMAWYEGTAVAATAVFRPDLAASRDAGTPPLPAVPSFADHGEAVTWCLGERRNVLAVLREAADSRRPTAWRLPMELFHFYAQYSYLEDLRESHRIGLEAAEAYGDHHARFRMLTGLWASWARQERLQEALGYAERALRCAQDSADPATLSTASAIYASALYFAGKYDDAIIWFAECLPALQAGPDHAASASAMNNLAIALHKVGRNAEALPLMHQALDVVRTHGLVRFEASMLDTLGDVYTALSDLPKAIENYRKAAEIDATLGLTLDQAYSLRRLGCAMAAAGHHAAAREAWIEAATLFEANDQAAEAESVREKVAEVGRG